MVVSLFYQHLGGLKPSTSISRAMALLGQGHASHHLVNDSCVDQGSFSRSDILRDLFWWSSSKRALKKLPNLGALAFLPCSMTALSSVISPPDHPYRYRPQEAPQSKT